MPLSARLRIDPLRLQAGQRVDVRAGRAMTLADRDKPRSLCAAHEFENVPPFESPLPGPTCVMASPAVAVLQEFTCQGEKFVIGPKPWATYRRPHGRQF